VKTFASLVTLTLLVVLTGCGSSTVEGQPSAAPSASAVTITSTPLSMDDSCPVQNKPTDSKTATIIKPWVCSHSYTPKNGETPNAACGYSKGRIELNADKLAELKTHRTQVSVEGPGGLFMIYVTDGMIAIVWVNTEPLSIVVNKQQTGLIRDLGEPLPYTSHLLFEDWTGGIGNLQICF